MQIKIRLILISSYAFALTTFISSCSNNVTDDLIKTAEQKCVDKKHSPCVISINEVTKFQWDKLYLFSAWTNSDTISHRIGFEYTGEDVPDDYTRMLFTKGGKIAHEEDFKTLDYYGSAIEIRSAFDSLTAGKSFFIRPNQAIFKVDTSKDKQACKGCYIYLFTALKKK